MVKIAIAAATSELAREIIDVLVATQKHEIVALVRKDPAQLPALPGVTWTQTTFQDEAELVRLFNGVETVLCFITVHMDPGSEIQKRLIDAAVKAGVKRYAPSEWSCGVGLESSLDVMPWYAGKIEVAQYLESINKEKKVIEYSRFQVGQFLNYLGHPHRDSKYLTTIALQVDYEKKRGFLEEGKEDVEIVLTSARDIANVVARAIEYKGEWPAVGGVRGSLSTMGELIKIGERLRGEPFDIDYLQEEDLVAGELKTDKFNIIALPSIPEEQREAFTKMATVGILRAIKRGIFNVTDEWNKILPDYKFEQAEEFVQRLWN